MRERMNSPATVVTPMSAAAIQTDWPFGFGFCCCGCGARTNVIEKKDARPGINRFAGQPYRYLRSHIAREKHGRWKGGRISHRQGYVLVRDPDHPRAHNGYILEHIVVVERAIGRFLAPQNEVHHVNEVRNDNGPGNLVACEDHAYHAILHLRMRALRESGNANNLLCCLCGAWDSPDALRVRQHARRNRDGSRRFGIRAHHIACRRKRERDRKLRANYRVRLGLAPLSAS